MLYREDTDDNDTLIRPAQPQDAAGIAEVLVDTFLNTYRGLIQDKSLDRLSVPGMSTHWEQVISSQGDDPCWVAVDRKTNEVLGYAYGGSSRDVTLPDGEIYQFYILPKAQGRKIGRRLFLQFARALWCEGYVSMIVHVLDGTPAMHFYQHMGGIPVGSGTVSIDGRSYRETSFRWPDLDEFMD